MTLSERIPAVLLLFILASGPVLAADPPDAAMIAASQAISAAERSEPQGPAADLLARARDLYGQASDAVSRRKYKDALHLADQARAVAAMAEARSRLIRARADVDQKQARNADLRRQLQMQPEAR
jgi:predicted S18 family serine protease